MPPSIPPREPAGSRRRARAYLELLRPANVSTAPADVLAGAAVAGVGFTPPLLWLLLATICLYAGGIVLNDYFDRELDASERPERPIPSGRIRATSAGLLGALLLLGGIGLAAAAGRTPAIVALAIALAVLSYDSWGKHHAFLGPVNMGLCRALNLMLGVAAAPAALAISWPLGLLPLVYIAAVTMVSRGEVHGAKQPVVRAGLVLVAGVVAVLGLLAWFSPAGSSSSVAALASISGSNKVAALVLTGWLAWRILPAFWRAHQDPSPGPIRAAVRTGVLSLVLLDSVIAASYAGIIYSLVVLATGLLAWWLARLFAVT